MALSKTFAKVAAIICLFAAAIGCGKQTDKLTMVVGTYNDSTVKGIRTYRFNQKNGHFSKMLAVLTVDNSSYLTICKNGTHIFAVSEMDDTTADLNDIAFDAKTGYMTFLNAYLTGATDPCYVAENGKLALTANYGGGSMTMFPIADDGFLQAADTIINGNVGGPDPSRQQDPHIHCACFSPEGKYIFASDFSSDSLLRFTIKEENNIGDKKSPVKVKTILTERKSFAVNTDFGPRHIIFDNSGKHLYVIGELSGAVAVFSYNNGDLKLIQTIIADEAKARGSADIHFSPDGNFLYASCRLKNDGIAIFKVNHSTGELSKIGYVNTGKHPRNFEITPNGKYLLVACRDDNRIQVFKRNLETGELSKTHKKLKINKPVCIKFAQIN